MRLVCRDLTCHFGGVHAVEGVDLEVEGGSCLAVVGGNGSGKSTLLDLLSGLRAPTRGTVELDGELMAGPERPLRAGNTGPEVFASRGVRRTFQEPRLVANLSVDENVALGLIGRLHPIMGLPRSPRAVERREVPAARGSVALDVAGWRPVTALSYGQRKRVELARVLVSTPRVALLDEPLAGVAVADRPTLLAGVTRMVSAGAAVVLVEHDAAAVEAVADRVLVLERGTRRRGEGVKLAADGLEVRRGRRVVLVDVSLAAGDGEVVGVVGPNGSGKSTLLWALAGLIRPWRGTVHLDGNRVEGLPPQRLVRAGLCLVPQGRRVFPGLTVRRNLELGGWARRRKSAPDVSTLVDGFLARHPVLAERADVPAGSLSGGEQGLVVLGRALMAGPRVLLLDEPLMGLDPTSAGTVLDQVRELAASGAAVLVVDHDRDALASVVTRTLSVDRGRLSELEAGCPPAA